VAPQSRDHINAASGGFFFTRAPPSPDGKTAATSCLRLAFTFGWASALKAAVVPNMRINA